MAADAPSALLLGVLLALGEVDRQWPSHLPKRGWARRAADLSRGRHRLGIGALQVLLDRGGQLDWFGSGEILTEAIIAAAAFYMFFVHTFTADEPFVRPVLFRDRNFAAGMAFIFVIGVTYLASLALITPYLQSLMNYPIVTAGLVLGPRGLGTMAAMMIVGRLVGQVDTRLLLAVGLGLTAWSLYDMTGWTPDVSQMMIMGNGLVQGAGLGFLFVPLSAVTLGTLPPEQRTEGAGLYNLSRNIGSSVGISVVTSLLTQNTQANHAEIVQHVTAVNRVFENPTIAQFWNPATDVGRAALDAMITRQAQIIAYIDDFKLLMIATLAVIPLLMVFKQASEGGRRDHTLAVE
jgi:DHA2 family multidrug resistance protein